MEENANWTREIIQNNELLKEQNAILRQLLCEQNAIFQQLTCGESDEREVFVENIDHDEIRDGFLVTSQRKKLWNVQIGLINEVARICKKHNIRWFAGYGTLLGAARHKGFIPWDDDVDLLMFRPDYDKFQRVAATEIKAPYFFDNWYNYRLESEGASLTDPEGDFQFITKQQQINNFGTQITYLPMIKIRDSRTCMLEYTDRNFINQGIWIDIFPLDPVPPFTQKKHATKFEVEKTLLFETIFSQKTLEELQSNENFSNDNADSFLALPYRKRGEIFERFMSDNFFPSEYVSNFAIMHYSPSYKPFKTESFSDVIYLPFEKIEVPAPVDYDNALQTCYGDWRTPIYRPSHVQICSPEISWREYFQKTAFK